MRRVLKNAAGNEKKLAGPGKERLALCPQKKSKIRGDKEIRPWVKGTITPR